MSKSASIIVYLRRICVRVSETRRPLEKATVRIRTRNPLQDKGHIDSLQNIINHRRSTSDEQTHTLTSKADQSDRWRRAPETTLLEDL